MLHIKSMLTWAVRLPGFLTICGRWQGWPQIFLSLSMLLGSALSHWLWARAWDLLYSRSNTSKSETWKVLVQWGVPSFVVLGTQGPSCLQGDEWPCGGEARHSSQPGNDCRPMSEPLRRSALPGTDWEVLKLAQIADLQNLELNRSLLGEGG